MPPVIFNVFIRSILWISAFNIGDRTSVAQSPGDRAREDFHTLFHISDFNGDAERIAYEQFKPHLGQIKYSAVSYMYWGLLSGIYRALLWALCVGIRVVLYVSPSDTFSPIV